MYVCMYVCMILFSPYIVLACIFAPLSASSATISERPLEAAAIRGVIPSYHTRKRTRHQSCISCKDKYIHKYIHTNIHTYLLINNLEIIKKTNGRKT